MKLVSIIFITMFFCLNVVSAASIDLLKTDMAENTKKFKETAGFGAADVGGNGSLQGIISTAIQGFLSLLAIIFIILIIVAGYGWMTAGGDEQKVTKAKDTIEKAIIGLIIIVAAYSITFFVFKYIPFGTTTP